MSKLVTTKDFIQRAVKVHGDRYDYSKVTYVAAIKDVTIICPEHGEFKQRPANHYIGHGCHQCGGNKPLKLDRFIERAQKIHKDKYNYSLVKFKNVETKVEILCPEHGIFLQRVMSHLKGFGCDQCGRVETAKTLSHSLERFLDDARRVHGDRYNYSQVKYVNALSKVSILCTKHGPFRQKPANHIRNVGCPKCGDESTAEKRTKSTQDFVRDAQKKHGTRYDYSKVEYKNSKNKVEIICEAHGSFWQTPLNHLGVNTSGCPGCAVTGFDQTKPGLLYYLAVKTDAGETLYKVGITNLSIQKRFPTPDLAHIRIIKTWQFEIGRIVAEREADILSQFSRHRYHGPDVLVGAGNTELFIKDVLGLDGDQENGQSPIDAKAILTSKPTQLCLDL